MNIEEHLELANNLAIAAYHLELVQKKLRESYGDSNKLNTTYLTLFNRIGLLQHRLDDQYFKDVTTEQIDTHGIIYYPMFGKHGRYAKNT